MAKGELPTRVNWDAPVEGGPLDYGFDYYFGNPWWGGGPVKAFIENRQYVGNPVLNRGQTAFVSPGWKEGERQKTELNKALEFLGEHHMANTMSESDVPFFLYYSPTTPHVPWTPGTEINGVPTGGVSSAGPRGDEVVQFDAIVGHLIAKLRSLGIMDNTLLIVTSDNGPHLNGDPSGNTFGHDSTGGLRGRKLDVWEGGHRVPFIAHWGGGTPDGFVIPPGLVSDEVIGLQDLMATVADLTHFELPTDAAEDSESILSELLGDKSDGRIRNALLHQAERGRGGYAVRDGEWKLILQHTPQHIGLFATGLYNIVDDPTETTNIISQHPQIVTRMVGIVGQYREMGASARRLIGIPTPNAAEGGVVLLSMGAIHVGVFLVRQHRRSSPRTK